MQWQTASCAVILVACVASTAQAQVVPVDIPLLEICGAGLRTQCIANPTSGTPDVKCTKKATGDDACVANFGSSQGVEVLYMYYCNTACSAQSTSWTNGANHAVLRDGTSYQTYWDQSYRQGAKAAPAACSNYIPDSWTGDNVFGALTADHSDICSTGGAYGWFGAGADY